MDKNGNAVDWFLEIKGNGGYIAHYLDANDYT